MHEQWLAISASARQTVGVGVRVTVVWVIESGGGKPWREVRHQEIPGHLSVRVRLAPTLGRGLAVAGVQVERRDGRAVTARDLRLVKLPPSWVLSGESPAQWLAAGPGAQPVRPSRGTPRASDDDHLLAVYLAWREAMTAAPQTPVRWLLTTDRWRRVPHTTMRRWITRARQRAAEVGWEGRGEPPQIVGQNLRYDEDSPAETPPGRGPDSA